MPSASPVRLRTAAADRLVGSLGDVKRQAGETRPAITLFIQNNVR